MVKFSIQDTDKLVKQIMSKRETHIHTLKNIEMQFFCKNCEQNYNSEFL